MSQNLTPFSTAKNNLLDQEFNITEEEFNLYKKFIKYDYIEDILKLSIKIDKYTPRYGITIKMSDETTCQTLKVAIRKAQEYLIFKTKDQLCNLL